MTTLILWPLGFIIILATLTLWLEARAAVLLIVQAVTFTLMWRYHRHQTMSATKGRECLDVTPSPQSPSSPS